MFLVKFDFNYADEYDVVGFELMTMAEVNLMLASARDVFDRGSVTCGWGGNDYIEFETYESGMMDSPRKRLQRMSS